VETPPQFAGQSGPGVGNCQRLDLVIVHHHFRACGVRRVIELATPALARAWGRGLRRVVLAGGEPPPAAWLAELRARLPGLEVACRVEPALGYLAEQAATPATLSARLRDFFARAWADQTAADCVVWAHNLGLCRNPLVNEALARACAGSGVTLVLHHHDWWFDHRWQRWPEMRACGIRTLAQAAARVFLEGAHVRHAAINRLDHRALRRGFGRQAGWLPNLVSPGEEVSAAAARAARRWLDDLLGERGATVWLVPSRLLRRKNLAEAWLLTRWLRPEAWLVTTGGVSSQDERPYSERLALAAKRGRWRLRLGVLAANRPEQPAVPELLAAGEAVLLTSLQEGFGLPYLEAARAGRPLVARLVPNVALDLESLGFRFPQGYKEVLVPTGCLDWAAERKRQVRFFDTWRRRLPAELRARVTRPAWIEAGHPPASLAFSRLTLTAQLELLAMPPDESWAMCAPLNSFLKTWQSRAATRALQVTSWPAAATRRLGAEAYARRLLRLLRVRPRRPAASRPALVAQRAFLARALSAANQYPLLWQPDT